MSALHNQTLKKYTVAILDAFNDIKIPVYNKKGKITKEIKVPIQFGNKDKAYRLDNLNSNLKAGNNYTLPRMALSFNSMNKATNRDTSKYSKINLKSKEDNRKMVQFQFNSVAYDFQFTLHIATRTLSEMMLITESITPLFRPTYTLPVFELDIQEEPTDIILELNGVELNIPEELADDELRIIMCDIPLNLRGNMYLPIMDEQLITKMRLYVNERIEKDLNRAVEFYQFEIDNENILNEFSSKDPEFIEKVKANEGHKGW